MEPVSPQNGSPNGALHSSSFATTLTLLESNAALTRATEQQLQLLLERRRGLLQAAQALEQEHVLAVLANPALGFSRGRPVAALLLLRTCERGSLLHPGARDSNRFVAQAAALLARQLQGDMAGVGEGDSSGGAWGGAGGSNSAAHAAYWVATAAAMLYLLAAARTAGVAGGAGGMGAGAGALARKAVGEISRRFAQLTSTRSGVGLLAASPPPPLLRSSTATGGSGNWAWRLGAAAAAASGVLRAATPPKLGAGAGGDAVTEEGALSEDSFSAGRPGLSGGSMPPSPGPDAGVESLLAAEEADAVLQLMETLDGLLQRGLCILWQDVKRRLTPLLSVCMTPPGGSAGGAPLVSAAGGSGAWSVEVGETAADTGSFSATDDEQQQLARLMSYRPWCELVGTLHDTLTTLRSHCVPRSLQAALFQRTFGFINAQLFNQLLLRPECCSVAAARYSLRGLKHLDGWLLQAGQEEVAGSWAALAHTREALQLLVLQNKGALSLEDISQELCPSLSPQQLYRVCTTAWADEASGSDAGGAGSSVSGEVLELLQQLHPNLSNGGLIVTCLLDEPPGHWQLQLLRACQAAGWQSLPEALERLVDGHDYGAGVVPLPEALLSAGADASAVPAAAFDFMQLDVLRMSSLSAGAAVWGVAKE